MVQGVLGLETQLGNSECHTYTIVRHESPWLSPKSYQVVAASLLASGFGNVDDLLALSKGELVLVGLHEFPLSAPRRGQQCSNSTSSSHSHTGHTFIALPGVNWPKMLVSFKMVMYSLSDVSDPGIATAVPK